MLQPSSNARVQSLVVRAQDLEDQLSKMIKSEEEQAARLRSHLCEVFSDILISDPVTGLQCDCTGRLWKCCFYGPINVWRRKVSHEKRKNLPTFHATSQSFKRFLNEAVTLYDYIIAQYRNKLLPSVSNQDESQLSTQGSTQTVSQQNGVVPILLNLYLNMGDLHRYADAFNKAESCYLNASKLAPGLGSPYNQLAVVCQTKDTSLSCAALYYYARSLLCTHESSGISSGNLERLFSINREALKNHSRTELPPVLPVPNKKTPADMQRARKTATNKACLSFFVDLHADLFQQTLEYNSEESMKKRMSGILKSFESLLEVSGLSDSLITKMLVINVFSVEVTKSKLGYLNQALAVQFFLDFGASLATRLMTLLAKIKNSKSPSLTSSIRLLAPFCVFCEYLGNSHFGEGHSESPIWHDFVSVVNVLRDLKESLEPPAGWEGGKTNVCPDELRQLKGFTPFNFLFPDYENSNPHVDNLVALDVLNLTQTQTEELPPSTAFENQERINRIVTMAHACCSRGDIPVSFDQGNFVRGLLQGESSETNLGGAAELDDEDNEAGDTVVFQSPPEAVPASIYSPPGPTVGMSQSSINPPIVPVLAQTTTEVRVPESSLKPPPGFSAIPVNQIPQPPQQYHQQPTSAIPPLPVNIGFHGVPPVMAEPVQGIPLVAESMDYFVPSNSVQTNNPYAYLYSTGAPSRENNSWYENVEPVSRNDGAELLSSGLLESLFLGDNATATTQNPFTGTLH
eukprot:Nitzschia sp. Nitz4//scaffold16_size188269//171356//173584//NITZ4_001818-RA/size188269-processed-gene-0.71-mRNA-1//-1//CDS//3329538598//6580//frame0